MAFASPVPDSGGGSGSSTATFGDSIGHVFAMPTRQSDTSSAAEGSGVDVTMPIRQPRRRPQGSNSASPGARSLGHATSPRHGGPSTSPTSRMAPTQSRSAGSQGMRSQDQRGRSGSRKLSDTVGGFQEHSVRSPFSPVGSHGESMQRDRSHYGSPSQHASAVGSPSYVPTRLDTPVLTPHHSYTPTRVDTPAWEVREDRWAPGRNQEKRAMDHGSLSSYSHGKRSNSPATRAEAPATRGEALSYHPSHHSPAASPAESLPNSPVGFNLEIYRGGQLRQVEHIELGEQRMVVKMTISEYHLLMKEFDAHIAAAR